MIVKARYTTTRQSATERIRYITHRPDGQGKRGGRELFDSQGRLGRVQAYAQIDQAGPSDVFYHLIISPDPKTEDVRRDLHLRLLTQETLLSLGRSLGEPVSWAAAIHADHTPHRHVHVLVIAPRLNRDHLALLRDAAGVECRMQRLELDRYQQAEQERQGEQEEEWELSLSF